MLGTSDRADGVVQRERSTSFAAYCHTSTTPALLFPHAKHKTPPPKLKTPYCVVIYVLISTYRGMGLKSTVIPNEVGYRATLTIRTQNCRCESYSKFTKLELFKIQNVFGYGAASVASLFPLKEEGGILPCDDGVARLARPGTRNEKKQRVKKGKGRGGSGKCVAVGRDGDTTAASQPRSLA